MSSSRYCAVMKWLPLRSSIQNDGIDGAVQRGDDVLDDVLLRQPVWAAFTVDVPSSCGASAAAGASTAPGTVSAGDLPRSRGRLRVVAFDLNVDG
jgi:hypothetical protein